MDLLTDSQLRIINEFRERVRQSEKRLRETLDSKGLRDSNPNQQPESSYNTIDSLKGSDIKTNSYESLNNSRPNIQKSTLSPLEETLPQRLLKPVVFNAGSPNGIESILRLSESLKSDHRSPKLGTENRPPPRKEYDSLISNPPSAKLDARYQVYRSEKESQREELRDLPQRVDDSLLKTKYSSNQSFTRSPNHSYEVSPANNFSRLDSYAKRPEEFRSPNMNTSLQQERSDPNYLYFIESGKNNRLAVPSIRLFEYDRKDDPPVRDVRERRSSQPGHPEDDYNTRGSYKSQKIENRSPIRRSPMRRTGDHESFDLGRNLSGIVSPHNDSAEGLDTFGNRSIPKKGRRRSQGSKGNILAYEDYKMNETSPIDREGRRTFSHPDKKKSSTPTKSQKKASAKNFRPGKSRERDESTKKKEDHKARREREENLENEPRRICKELIRRLKLGTLDTSKFVSIMEDHMFFSTRFLENLKTVIKK